MSNFTSFQKALFFFATGIPLFSSFFDNFWLFWKQRQFHQKICCQVVDKKSAKSTQGFFEDISRNLSSPWKGNDVQSAYQESAELVLGGRLDGEAESQGFDLQVSTQQVSFEQAQTHWKIISGLLKICVEPPAQRCLTGAKRPTQLIEYNFVPHWSN